MYDHPEKTYVFVIDTNDDTTKFYKQLTAHITGYVDETGIGQAESDKYCADLSIDNIKEHTKHITKLPSSDGMIGCSVWRSVRNNPKNKKPLYNSVGIFWSRPIKDYEMPILMERAYDFADEHAFQIFGFRVMHVVLSLWTDWKGKVW